jgi:hypothetical protein
MRHKTNEFLRRLQLARPEVKKNFRRGATNAAGRLNEKKSYFLIKIFSLFYLGDAPAGLE